MGKKTTIVCHHVIIDIGELSGHINLNNKLKTSLLNFCIHVFYRMLLLFCYQVIVFDKILKDNLALFGNPNKIKVIPHGVEEFKNPVSRSAAREKINFSENDFVLLYFGYLAWYKGADWLVDEYAKLKAEQVTLIMAGGPNPNHAGKGYYQDYIRRIEDECREKGVLLTGFVKEEDIPLYFAASDVVVLPYRTLMSASGPLSIAFSFKKPFLVSEELSPMFETEDIKKTLDQLGINKADLIFSTDFKEKIKKIRTDSEFRNKIEELSQVLAQKRSWEKIGKAYYETLF
jgi:glycosyltransferase involved in cell wall biosynthesis